MNLQPGDVIDVIAPSSAPQNNRWKKGFDILRGWGLKPRLTARAIAPWLFHANSDKNRALFLKQAFLNKDSSAVWMLRGGYGLQKLMPFFVKINSQNFRKKLFIGYSDGTALHLYLNGKNQKTLQAPMICELPALSQKELARLKTALFGAEEEIVFNNLTALKASRKILKAFVIGGNLSLLSSSVGAPWFPLLKSHFLFVEDVNEEDYRVDRLLHHLLYSGSLKGVKALLFGHFHPLSQRALRERALKSLSRVCQIPMIFGLPCGHKNPHFPLFFKAPAELAIQGRQAILKIKAGAGAAQKAGQRRIKRPDSEG